MKVRRAADRERVLGEIEMKKPQDCSHCPNQGWYPVLDKNTGEPIQEQCKWCWTNENSVFFVNRLREVERTWQEGNDTVEEIAALRAHADGY